MRPRQNVKYSTIIILLTHPTLLYNIFLTLILSRLPSSTKMILKLVFNKEIHVYDLKAHQSLDHVCQKIKELFKKVPSQFILCYKNPQQHEIPLNTNQQFDILMESIKNDLKIFKLFIKEKSKPSPNQVKSEPKIQTNSNQQFNEMTQIIQCSKQIDQISQKFTHLNELNQENEKLAQIQQRDENSNNEVNAKEFQHLETEEATKIEENLSERQQPSERQLHVNAEQSSDPQDLRTSSSNQVQEKKQKLNQKLLHEEKLLEQKPEFKACNQKVDLALLPNLGDLEVPQIDLQVEDDFKSHNVTCDICNAFPICGARFKCVVCQNYDLCQTCQHKYQHDHPLLKICYTFQTPIKIQVDIPQYKQKSKEQSKIVFEKVNLQQLTAQQRRQRVLSLSSQISQLLNRDLKECYGFVGKNEEYTKETLIQMLIEGKRPEDHGVVQKKKEQSKHGIGGFFTNVKGYIFGNQ